LEHNPNLKQDTLAVGLAAQITGLQGQFAINALLQNDNRNALLKNARKNQPKDKKSSNKIEWKDLPGWSWLFIVACAAIPIISLGGLVPGAIGFGAATGCASVAGNKSLDTVTRMIFCVGITIFAWALFIGFIILIASSGVAG
jgi:hypothetical protein